MVCSIYILRLISRSGSCALSCGMGLPLSSSRRFSRLRCHHIETQVQGVHPTKSRRIGLDEFNFSIHFFQTAVASRRILSLATSQLAAPRARETSPEFSLSISVANQAAPNSRGSAMFNLHIRAVVGRLKYRQDLAIRSPERDHGVSENMFNPALGEGYDSLGVKTPSVLGCSD